MLTSLSTWTPLPHRGVITITGPDRRAFLQGLVTQDVEKLTSVPLLYSLFLTPQGRFLYDLFLFEVGETIYLECDKDVTSAFAKRLNLYKLRRQVTIQEGDETITTWVNWRDSSPLEAALFQGADPRVAALGQRAWRREPIPPTAEALPYHLHRVRLGVPEGQLDMIPEKSIPLECGMDTLQAIDWQKGCYLGQELTARTRYRGLVRKKLLPVGYHGLEEVVGAPILKEGQAIGTLHHSYPVTEDEWVAFALLRLEALEAEEEMSLADGRGVSRAGGLAKPLKY